MRIAMVSEHASPLAALGGVDAGGQNVHVAELSSALVRAGHEVTVYTRRDSEDLPRRVVTPSGVDVVHVDAGPPRAVEKDGLLPHMPAFAEELAAEWSTSRPEVAHSHFWMSGLATVDAVRRLGGSGIRTAHTFHALGTVKRRHQGAADTSPPERVELEALLGREVDRVVATCADEVAELRAMAVPSEKISVVPCGVDLTVFTPTGEAEARGTRHRLLSLSRLVPRKGVELVLRALGALHDAGRTSVELLVVGGSGEGDQEADRLKALAHELGIEDSVEFRGPVPSRGVPRILRSADLVVCAPWYEPFGIVPLEAMASGVPVVAAAVGGLTDSVVDGRTGLLVPPRDPDALAAAIVTLLDDPDRRKAMGRAGRERMEQGYSWDRVAERTLAAYPE